VCVCVVSHESLWANDISQNSSDVNKATTPKAKAKAKAKASSHWPQAKA